MTLENESSGKNHDGREWIRRAMTEMGGATNFFSPRRLTPRQLEGADEPDSCIYRDREDFEGGDDQQYWTDYKIK